MSTYTQIYIQIVFAVQGRLNLIQPEWEESLHKYISGYIRNSQQKLLAINGTINHLHILFGMTPTCRLSDFVRELKKSSNRFINDNRLCRYKFTWQEGYGGFSYSRPEIDHVIKYILNQKEHHRNISFRNEFLKYLKDFEIEHDDKYLPDFFDE
jgi:putative transposase